MDREGGVVVYGDRYRAVAYVARRPWATVFRAIDERDGGVVALSVVSPGAAPRDDFGAYLAEEASLLDGFSHPNVLPVLDVGVDQGSHYLAEEWVDGPTLAEVVAARGALPAERVAMVLDDLADGLGAAHAAGIVHGGPAPADVWLAGGPGGPARLHGLALLRAVVLASVDEGLPPAGERPYLAPECLAGEPGGPAADLYGLGAIAFEALCGVAPFGRDGRPEGADPPWPSDLVEGIPEGLDDVVLDLLEADPADRHHDAVELREELAPFLRRPRVLSAAPAGVAAAAATVDLTADAEAAAEGDGDGPLDPGGELEQPADDDAAGELEGAAEASSGVDLAAEADPGDEPGAAVDAETATDHDGAGPAAAGLAGAALVAGSAANDGPETTDATVDESAAAETVAPGDDPAPEAPEPLPPAALPAEPAADVAPDEVDLAGADDLDAGDEAWDEWQGVEAEWEPDPTVDWQPEVVTPVSTWAPEHEPADVGGDEWAPEGEPAPEAVDRPPPPPPPPPAPAAAEGHDGTWQADEEEWADEEWADEEWVEDEWADEQVEGDQPAAHVVEGDAGTHDAEPPAGEAWDEWEAEPEGEGVAAPPAGEAWDEWEAEPEGEGVGAAPDDLPPWVPPSEPGDGGGRRRGLTPLVGAGIVAALLVVIALGLVVVDRALDTESAGESTTTTEAPSTTSTTAATSSTTATTVAVGPDVPLPDVVGTGIFQAADAITQAGFVPVVEQVVDPTAQQGFVVEQDPPAGVAPQGSEVRLVYAEPQ